VSRFKNEAQQARKENIIDMGLTFAAMLRLFSEGSKEFISKLFLEMFDKLEGVKSQDDYTTLHKQYCEKFSDEVNTAQKKLKNGRSKPSKKASFGQAAKTLDIVIKVYIHYSNLPNGEIADRVKPFLHSPIDNPILKYLKKKYSSTDIKANSIESIDKEQYYKLQKLIEEDIEKRFNKDVCPVEFDDILWKEQNRNNA
jgi:hypothetical protein